MFWCNLKKPIIFFTTNARIQSFSMSILKIHLVPILSVMSLYVLISNFSAIQVNEIHLFAIVILQLFIYLKNQKYFSHDRAVKALRTNVGLTCMFELSKNRKKKLMLEIFLAAGQRRLFVANVENLLLEKKLPLRRRGRPSIYCKDDTNLEGEEELPFRCSRCPSSFSYLRGLQQHVKYACCQKPRFQCPYCSCTSKYRYNAYNHVRNTHRGCDVYCIDLNQQKIEMERQ